MNGFIPGSHGFPPALVDWPPILQALSLGLATFVQEDVPTVTAAILAAAGVLSTAAGFWGIFLGSWGGDLLLFGLARVLGRPVLELGWVKKRISAAQVARQEAWFSERGTWLLLSARMIPGTRLPTYLAAGVLRWPIGQFLAVTGGAALVWTMVWFGLARLLGDQLPGIWSQWQKWAWIPVLGLAMLFAGRAFLKHWRNQRPGGVGDRSVRWKRWLHWEFWPAWLFYPPIVGRYIYLSIRHWSLTLPTAANPGIAFGGMVGESKMATLRDLQETSPEYTAEAWYLAAAPLEERIGQWRRLQAENQLTFPLILKPDFGQRGMGVKRVRTEAEAIAYLEQNEAPLVLQRYIPGPFEAGVFYYRFPGESQGHLFAITEKIFPVVTGDGTRTLEELIWADPRARFVADRYLIRFEEQKNRVLGDGENFRLVEAGNHAQGCIFRDGTHLATPAMLARFDEISRQVPEFFIGRYDVRYADESEFAAGRGFKILELNGAAAEATSVYDARYSIVQAYRILFRQWGLVFEIGAANRRLGHAPCKNAELIRAWRDAKALFERYPIAD